MFAIDNNYIVNNIIIINKLNKERICRNSSKLYVLIILLNIITINITNIKIMFIELNNKDIYCVYIIWDSKDFRNIRDSSAFINIFQLKSKKI